MNGMIGKFSFFILNVSFSGKITNSDQEANRQIQAVAGGKQKGVFPAQSATWEGKEHELDLHPSVYQWGIPNLF